MTSLKHLDLKCVPCPLNVVKIKLALEKLSKNEQLIVELDKGEPLSSSTISCSFLDNFSKANLILTTFKGHGTDLRSKCFKDVIKILYQIIY